jgi:hypothetical protein
VLALVGDAQHLLAVSTHGHARRGEALAAGFEQRVSGVVDVEMAGSALAAV